MSAKGAIQRQYRERLAAAKRTYDAAVQEAKVVRDAQLAALQMEDDRAARHRRDGEFFTQPKKRLRRAL